MQQVEVLRLRMSRAKRRRAAIQIATDAARVLNRGERSITISVTDRATLAAFGKHAGPFGPEALRRLGQRVTTELLSAHPGDYGVIAQRRADGNIDVRIEARQLEHGDRPTGSPQKPPGRTKSSPGQG